MTHALRLLHKRVDGLQQPIAKSDQTEGCPEMAMETRRPPNALPPTERTAANQTRGTPTSPVLQTRIGLPSNALSINGLTSSSL